MIAGGSKNVHAAGTSDAVAPFTRRASRALRAGWFGEVVVSVRPSYTGIVTADVASEKVHRTISAPDTTAARVSAVEKNLVLVVIETLAPPPLNPAAGANVRIGSPSEQSMPPNGLVHAHVFVAVSHVPRPEHTLSTPGHFPNVRA